MASRSKVSHRSCILFLLAVLLAAGTGIVSAHAPLSVGSNEEIDNATLFANPEKSFVLYTELDAGGEAQYYLFPMKSGQVLYGSLQVPGPDSMVPDLVIIGPGIPPSGTVPPFVQVPAGSGARVISGKTPGKPVYEPFTPQPIYEVADFNITVPQDGNYYVAVYGPEGGKYSLAPGYLEEFTAEEWLLIPWSVVSIHLWEGQSPAVIFAPLVIVVIGGLALLVVYRKERGLIWGPANWLILVAGLLYIGGAAMTALQVVHAVLRTGYTPAVLVTLLFIMGPLVLGIVVVLTGIRPLRSDSTLRTGMSVLVIGLFGLLVWAGLIIGPLLAVAAGLIVLGGHFRKATPA
jgi:hypothetical protein